jgi:hypothetical protein
MCLFIAIILICYYLFNHRPNSKPTTSSKDPQAHTRIKFISRINDHVRIIKNFGCGKNSFENGKSLLQKAQELIERGKIGGNLGWGSFTEKKYSKFDGSIGIDRIIQYDDDLINFLKKVFSELQKIVFSQEMSTWITATGAWSIVRKETKIAIVAINKQNRIEIKRGNDWHKDNGVRCIAFWLIPPSTLRGTKLQGVTQLRHQSYRPRDGSSGLGEAIKQKYHPGDLVFCDNSIVQHRNPFDNDKKFLESIDDLANVNHFIQFGIRN